MTVATPYAWLKHLSPNLIKKEEGPVLGYPPPFPWEEFAKRFIETFELQNLTFQSTPFEWTETQALFADLGTPSIIKEFSVAPIKGSLWWVMSEQDLRFLMGYLLKKQAHSEFEVDPDFLKAFNQFLTLEVVHAFQSLDFDKNLSIQMKENSSQPLEPSLCTNISILLPNETISGRLILSPQFCADWKSHYAQQSAESKYQTPMADFLEVVVHLEIGKTSLKTGELKNIIPGDFIILDSCSLKPDEDDGRVLLTINGKPFFRGKLKQGNLKILEYPLYHEVEEAMAKTHEEDEDEDFDDEHEESDFDESEYDDYEDEDEDEEDEDENEDEEEEYTDDESLVEETEEEETEEEDKAPQSTPAAKKEPAVPSEVHGEKKAPSIDDIPLILTAEVGRIQMTVKKLVDLQPGNLLELNVHPEDGIDLVVNGKRVARGELLAIGETLGIRVLEIG